MSGYIFCSLYLQPPQPKSEFDHEYFRQVSSGNVHVQNDWWIGALASSLVCLFSRQISSWCFIMHACTGKPLNKDIEGDRAILCSC